MSSVQRIVSVLWSGRTFCLCLSFKSKCLAVDGRLLSGGMSVDKTSSTTLLLVWLQWESTLHSCQALVDSGAEGNFMDYQFAHQLHLPLSTLNQPISVSALNGQNLPTITHTTGLLTLITSGNHSEVISFLLVDSPLPLVVLCHPWPTLHNPHIDWHSNTVLSWSERCHAVCLVSTCSSFFFFFLACQ